MPGWRGSRTTRPRGRHQTRAAGAGALSGLWACYVDFKQAYDRVPREQLWERLEEAELGGKWLEALRALYADVPMTVGVPSGAECPFQAHQGVKQGCTLSPTLFGLYIDDLEEEITAAAAGGAQLDLPEVVDAPRPLRCSLPRAAGSDMLAVFWSV